MLPQHALIARVAALCRADSRLHAVLQYGSFTRGEADRWSDIEFWLFVEDAKLPGLDTGAWICAVEQPLAVLDNEFGARVAVFPGLVRGEFHFAAASTMAQVRDWPLADEPMDPGAMVVLDRGGELRTLLEAAAQAPSGRLAPDRLQGLQDRFLNWFVLGLNLLERGAWARAADALANLHHPLLQLARVAEGRAGAHYLTPSKRLEDDLDPATYRRFVQTTSPLEPAALGMAYRAAWQWYRELSHQLAQTFGTDRHEELLREISFHLHGSL